MGASRRRSRGWRPPVELNILERGFIQQHNRDIVLHGIHPPALRALQALRLLPVFQGLLTGRTNQNLQQILGDHERHCTIRWRVPSTYCWEEIHSLWSTRDSEVGLR